MYESLIPTRASCAWTPQHNSDPIRQLQPQILTHLQDSTFPIFTQLPTKSYVIQGNSISCDNAEPSLPVIQLLCLP